MSPRLRRTPPLWLGVGVVLAVGAMGFAWRAARLDPLARAPASAGAPYAGPAGGAALQTLRRLASGLLACQEPAGWFRPRREAEVGLREDDAERTVTAALATAALARLLEVDPTAGRDLPGLADGLARGLAYLRRMQESNGTFARRESTPIWRQVEAAAAATLAFTVVGDPEDATLLEKAVTGLGLLAGEDVPADASRCLLAIAVARLLDGGGAETEGRGLRAPAPREALRGLLDVRRIEVVPTDASALLWDSMLSEAASRLVLAEDRLVPDPVVESVLAAIADAAPVWAGDATDARAWWSMAFLLARSGDGEAWFAALREALDGATVGPAPLLPGGFYASAAVQTAAAAHALLEGFTAPRSRGDGPRTAGP